MYRLVFLLLFVSILSAFPHPEGYYKHLFMDGGSSLTTRKYFPAGNSLAEELEFAYEFVATTSLEITQIVLAGFPLDNLNISVFPAIPVDKNGYLLYPDGSPRFKMIYVNGGDSQGHGSDLTEKGRQNFRDFYANGGSYVGTCAGAFIASLSNSNTPSENYFHLWPGYTRRADFATEFYPGLDFEDLDTLAPGIQNPLLQYHNFGGDGNVDWVRWHNGPYFSLNKPIPEGTEFLCRFDAEGMSGDNQVGIIAYKKDSLSGRAVLNSCHPEGDSSATAPFSTGERYELFSAKLRYAADGVGRPRVKATLNNNVARVMADNEISGYEKLGDYQYHHYSITVPSGAPFLQVVVDGQSGYPFNIYAQHGGFAFNSRVPPSQKETTRASFKTMTIPSPASGEWFIGIELDTTVNDTQAKDYPVYSGAVDVLEGISYSVKASYNEISPPQHTIFASAGIHGTISPSGTTSITHGSGALFHIRPDSAYEIDHITVDGLDEEVKSPFFFPCVLSDRTINVQFSERIYRDTLLVDNGMSGTSYTGKWASSSVANYFGTPSVYTGKSQLPAGSYTWTVPVIPGVTYSLEMWWTTLASRMSRIPVIIFDNNIVVDTVYVNQKTDGGTWNELLSSTIFSSDSARIMIVHNGIPDSTICADAIRLIGNPRTISGGNTQVENGVSGKKPPFMLSVGPNPFNPMAKILYQISENSSVNLSILDMRGRVISELVSTQLKPAGCYSMIWAGLDDNGKHVSNGFYLFRLKMGNKVKQVKAILLK